MPTTHALRIAWLTLVDFFFPARCAACDQRVGPTEDWCRACAAALVSGLDAACPVCGVVWLEPPPGGGSHVCGACLRSPPPYRRARALLAYGGSAQDAIAKWKNRPAEAVGRVFGELVAREVDALGLTASDRRVIVPIPSTTRALARRGFNPAAALARPLASALSAPLSVRALELAPVRGRGLWGRILDRRVAPPSSRGLGRAQRMERMRGCFRAVPKAVADRDVVLVDDVMTTGATISEAARACLVAGARSVEAVVLARVPGDA
jgi:predicted amidophosphoribosyltransferase